MKEKRYFCDLEEQKSNIMPIIVILFIILVGIIVAFISYNVLTNKFEYESDSYSEEDYEYLKKIAKNVVKDGESINLSAIPEDVAYYKITANNNEIILKLSLENNKDKVIAPSADITIKLSNKFDIISTKTNFSSKQEYVWYIKRDIVLISIASGIIAFFIVIFIAIIFEVLGSTISNKSKSHKKKGEKSFIRKREQCSRFLHKGYVSNKLIIKSTV